MLSHSNLIRKVVVKGNITEERIYIGNYEIYRKTTSGTLNVERETLHISNDKQRIATIDGNLVRYQLSDHLGSASLELDENADIISYEEYYPFGSTSYRNGRNEVDVSLKRYKYVMKELDNETGLYYYGMRYYTSWICRFISVDPLQHDYPYYTPFQYAGNMPISNIDLDGAEPLRFTLSQSANTGANTSVDEGVSDFVKEGDNVNNLGVRSCMDCHSMEGKFRNEFNEASVFTPENLILEAGYDESLKVFGYDTGIDDDYTPANEIAGSVDGMIKLGPLPYLFGRGSTYSSKLHDEAGFRGMYIIGVTSAFPVGLAEDIVYIQSQVALGREMEDILQDKGTLIALNSLSNSFELTPSASVFGYIDVRKTTNAGGDIVTLQDVLDGKNERDEITLWYENNVSLSEPSTGPKGVYYHITNSEGANVSGARIGWHWELRPTSPAKYTATPFIIVDIFDTKK